MPVPDKFRPEDLDSQRTERQLLERDQARAKKKVLHTSIAILVVLMVLSILCFLVWILARGELLVP